MRSSEVGRARGLRTHCLLVWASLQPFKGGDAAWKTLHVFDSLSMAAASGPTTIKGERLVVAGIGNFLFLPLGPKLELHLPGSSGEAVAGLQTQRERQRPAPSQRACALPAPAAHLGLLIMCLIIFVLSGSSEFTVPICILS